MEISRDKLLHKTHGKRKGSDVNNLILLCLGVLAFMAFHFKMEKAEPSIQITQEELTEEKPYSQSLANESVGVEFASQAGNRLPSSTW